MRLSPMEAKVLGTVQLDPFASAESIAHRTGLKVRSAYEALQRLRHRSVVESPKVAIDRSALGITEFCLMFSFAGIPSKQKSTLIKYIEQDPRLKFGAELGGRRQLSLLLAVRRTREVVEFIDEFLSHFGKYVHGQEIALRAGFSMFSRKYIFPSSKAQKSIQYGRATSTTELSEIDCAILESMTKGGWDSFRAVAARTKVSSGTVIRHVQDLQKSGVIAGFFLPISPKMLGIELFRIIVVSSNPQKKATERFFGWAALHPNVTGFSEMVGAWSYEFTIEVPSSNEAHAVSQQLLDHFAEEISEIEVVPMFRYIKSSAFDRVLRY